MATSDSVEAEQSLLGAILVDPDWVMPKIADIVQLSDFSDKSHQYIYKVMEALYQARKQIDVVTVGAALKANSYLDIAGGYTYLNELGGITPSVAHAEQYARIIQEASIKRQLLATSQVISDAVQTETDVDSLLQKAEGAIFAVGKARVKQNTASLAEILGTAFTRLTDAQAGNLPRGVSTGYREMDAILTGLMPSDLIILAARPSMGKTALALNWACNVGVFQDVPTLIFSMEMSKEQLVDRLLSMETGVSTEQLRSGKLSEGETKRVVNTMAVLSEAPVYIDDTPGVTIQSLRTRARREDHLHHLGLIIVDYLQLMDGSAGKSRSSNREQEISEISRGLKVIARELNIPVIALSQLSRQVESRDVKIPQLSDLRESGSIEQNADIVAFMYRDDYYNADSPRKNMTDILIRKHRNGRIGSVELYFDREHQKFRGVVAN